jgi:hypothetical protein
MSKLIAVRLPDDLVAEIEGKPISQVVIAALREWLHPAREGISTASVQANVRQQHAGNCKCLICKPPKGAV